jgi:hypothetical protein
MSLYRLVHRRTIAPHRQAHRTFIYYLRFYLNRIWLVRYIPFGIVEQVHHNAVQMVGIKSHLHHTLAYLRAKPRRSMVLFRPLSANAVRGVIQ